MESLIATFVQITSINIVRYFIVAGLAFVIFYMLFPHKVKHLKIQVKKATKNDFLREILHSLQTTFVFGLISVLVLETPVAAFTQVYHSVSDFPVWWIPGSLVLSLLLHDTYFYWMHRLMHHRKLYRKVHLVHHKSTNPSPWTSYSFHILEAVVEGLVIIPVLVFIPMHPIAIGLFISLGFVINVYGHLGFEIVPARFRNSVWFKILNTSVYHNMHHSHTQGNYSLYFRHWDRWMKTENCQYETYFDKVVERRKQSAEEFPAPSGNAVGKGWVHLKKVFMVLALILQVSLLRAQIEGKWMMEGREVLVEVYQRNGLYYCKVLDAGNVIENSVLKTQDVLLFSGLKKQSNTRWCCGTVFHPYKKVKAEGYAELVEKGRLKISGLPPYHNEAVYFRRKVS